MWVGEIQLLRMIKEEIIKKIQEQVKNKKLDIDGMLKLLELQKLAQERYDEIDNPIISK